ncbi:MAG: PPP family 3-phenylpropionic acid transporter [Candidatus Promineifilaceae bacterium]|jgi:PPP family 3-phenylpropionic acid transporter
MLPSFSVNNRFRLFFGVQFAGIGVFFSYIALYLNSLELTGSQLGLLFALIPLVTFLVQPLWGFATDIYHRQRFTLVFACFGVSASMIGLAQVTTFWPILLFTVIHAVMMAPIPILVTALALEHLSRQPESNLGSLRLWGSIGFAISSFGIGAWLLDQGGIWWILPLYGLCNVILGLVALFLPDADLHGHASWREGLTLLQRQSGLGLFLFGIMLIGFTHGIVNYYLAVYLTDIQAAGWVIGLALALSAIFEVPFMARAHTFMERWGVRPVLLFGMAMLVLRWFVYIFIKEPLLVLPTQVLHSIGMMSLLIVGVLYMDRLIEPKWRTSAQSLYTASFSGIGPAVGLYFAGILYSSYGIQSVWTFTTVVGLMGTIILAFAVYRR